MSECCGVGARAGLGGLRTVALMTMASKRVPPSFDFTVLVKRFGVAGRYTSCILRMMSSSPSQRLSSSHSSSVRSPLRSASAWHALCSVSNSLISSALERKSAAQRDVRGSVSENVSRDRWKVSGSPRSAALSSFAPHQAAGRLIQIIVRLVSGQVADVLPLEQDVGLPLPLPPPDVAVVPLR